MFYFFAGMVKTKYRFWTTKTVKKIIISYSKDLCRKSHLIQRFKSIGVYLTNDGAFGAHKKLFPNLINVDVVVIGVFVSCEPCHEALEYIETRVRIGNSAKFGKNNAVLFHAQNKSVTPLETILISDLEL